MPVEGLQRLALLIEREREDLLSRWREQVRQLPSSKGSTWPT
jgi:hypothetical protein